MSATPTPARAWAQVRMAPQPLVLGTTPAALPPQLATLDATLVVLATAPHTAVPATVALARAAHKASGDPRHAIEERSRAKEDSLRRVQQAAEALVQQGDLLAEDVPTVTEQASRRYDLCQSRVSVNAPVPPLRAHPRV